MIRHRLKEILGLVIITVLSVTAMYLFTGTEPPGGGDEKLVVVATIMPQKEFIEAVAGERAEVTVLVPPGADPHTYEPDPGTLKRVSEADAYFIVGSGIEFETQYLDRLRSINPDMLIVNTSRGIRFIPTQGGDEHHEDIESPYDPHVWTSPRNAMIMVRNTLEGLERIDPQGSRYYQDNANLYLERLGELDTRMKKTLEGREGEAILVYHPAWGYLCSEYGLRQVAIEREGKEPGPGTLSDIIGEARRTGIKVIFVSPQFSRKNAEMIADEIGAEVVVVDPLNQNYIENMEKILRALEKGWSHQGD